MGLAETRQLDLILNLHDKASKELKALSKKIDKIEPAFKKMSLVSTAALAGIGFGVKKAVDNAVDLGESINAVNVVFGDAADNITSFGKTAAKEIGIANAEFNQMATMTGALLSDTGKPMEEVADITLDLSKRAADMASVFNTDVSLAMSAINQAVRGETEAIRNFNSDVTDASIEQFALSKGINKSVSEMTFQEKKLLRVEKIMADTAVTAGDFENTQDSLANQQRILSAQFVDISATIGETFIPMISEIIKKVTPVINQFAQWAKDNPDLTKKIIIATAAFASLVAVIGALGLALSPLIATIAFMISPVGLVIAAISALIAIGVLLWKNWDRITNKARETWESIKDSFGSAVDWIKSHTIDPLIESFDRVIGIIDRVKDSVKGIGGKISGVIGGGNVESVNDAVITPQGDVIKTNPKDFLLATKTPGELVNAGGGGGTVNVTVAGGVFMDRNSAEKIAESLSSLLRTKLRL